MHVCRDPKHVLIFWSFWKPFEQPQRIKLWSNENFDTSLNKLKHPKLSRYLVVGHLRGDQKIE